MQEKEYIYMNDKELMDFIKWLPNNSELFSNLNSEETIAKINKLSSSDDGKETLKQLTEQYKNKEMKFFKDGGKLRHLLCLKAGGKGPDCGCNKVEKSQDGGDITRRYAFDVAKATGMDNQDVRKEYRKEKKELRSNGLKGEDLRQTSRKNLIKNALNSSLPTIVLDEISDEFNEKPLDIENKVFSALQVVPTSLGIEIQQKQTKNYNPKNFYNRWSKEDIKKLQTFLSRNGKDEEPYYDGDIDGIVGTKTINAVKKYQKEHNLKADGMWGFYTDQIQKVMGTTGALNKGFYGADYDKRHEQGDLISHDATVGATIYSLPKEDVAKAIEYYTSFPELFFSDDPTHAQWRQIFQNSGKDGADFVNMLYSSLSDADKKKVSHLKKTFDLKADEFADRIWKQRKVFWDGVQQLAPLFATPLLVGSGVTAIASGLGPALAFGTGIAGGYAGGKAGAAVGTKTAYDNALEKFTTLKDGGYEMEFDPRVARYGVSSGINYYPESIHLSRTAKEDAEKYGTIGGLTGGLAGGFAGTAAGTSGATRYHNHMGKGAAIRGWKDPYVVNQNVGEYGGITTSPADFQTWWGQFKAGFSDAPVMKGVRIRYGGPHGLKFATNTSTFKTNPKVNPGVYASPKQIVHATEMYTSPGSLINPRFGGQINLGTSAKIGNTYGANLSPMFKLYGSTTPVVFTTTSD